MNFLFDTLTLQLSNNQLIRCLSEDRSIENFYVAEHHAEDRFGTVTIAESHCGHCILWDLHAVLNQPVRIRLQGSQALLGLFINLGAQLTVQFLADHIAWTLASGHYNFVCIPAPAFDLEIEHSTHLLVISFTPEYLRLWEDGFPVLSRIMGSYDSVRHVQRVFDADVSVTIKIRALLLGIFENSYSGLRRRMFLATKAQELLLYALQNHSSQHPSGVIRGGDLEKIKEAYAYILQNLSMPISLKSLAHHAGINTFKLKKGFKQLYGTTVFQFIRSERMAHAHHLIETGDLPIEAIAFECGYRNLSNFTSAFKQHYGYPPSYIRKGKA